MLVSIDPGKKGIGWARFDGESRLQACGLIAGDTFEELSDEMQKVFLHMLIKTVVLEIPQVYQQRQLKGDPNDLIPIAVAGGMVLGVIYPDEIELVRPNKWKGQRPKKICNALTLKTLTDHERRIFDCIDCLASLRHNVIDAIGIGLWKLKRR